MKTLIDLAPHALLIAIAGYCGWQVGGFLHSMGVDPVQIFLQVIGGVR